MKKTLISFLTATALLAFRPGNAQDVFQRMDYFFKAGAQQGLTNASSPLTQPQFLDALRYDVGNTSLKGRSGDYRKSFLINVYNLMVLVALSEQGPVALPTDPAGLMDQRRFRVAGRERTLQEIKDELMQEGDWRMMLALACGNVGCPPSPGKAYTPENLPSQLNENARRLLNDPAYARADHRQRILYLPAILGKASTLADLPRHELVHLMNRYRQVDVPADYDVVFGTAVKETRPQDSRTRPGGR